MNEMQDRRADGGQREPGNDQAKTSTKKGTTAKNGSVPLRFTRLVLDNWRNFQRVDIPVPRRLFVVGPNASGKSNLVDALGFLHDLVAAGGGFRTAVAQSGGIRQLKCFSGKHYADIGITVDVGTDRQPRVWQYELYFNQDAMGQPLITRERISQRGKILKNRPEKEDEADKFRLGQTYLEQSGINKDFRALADFFLSVEHVEIVPQLVRRWLMPLGKARSLGATLLQELAQLEEDERDEILTQISRVLADAVPQLHALKYRYDPLEKRPRLEAQFQNAHGAKHLEDQLSDGTLRLFGMFFALARGKGPLLVEEPDASLHPAFVQHLPGSIARFQNRSGRQVIMTTHSPEMLRDEGISSAEVLLLEPSPDGTAARLAQDDESIEQLLGVGISLAESVPASTSPFVAARMAASRK
jgi:predicted ATPase